MKLWHLGNTTVRSPFRLRDGLIALSQSPLQGSLHGSDQEKAFRNLLGEAGIVELGEDKSYSVGRKWRSALNKLGFLYPPIKPSMGIQQKDIGPVDVITPNGWRLIRADSVPAMQECFLRALGAHFIPSPLETEYDFESFSPLRHTLLILLNLKEKTGSSELNFIEMAVVVQLSNTERDVNGIVNEVLSLREARDASDNKKQFDTEQRRRAALIHGYVESTFNDYADTNFRYLKATGLVHAKGRGISLLKEKQLFIQRLVEDTYVPENPTDYFITLCNGATLPTDYTEDAISVLVDLQQQLAEKEIQFDIEQYLTREPSDIAIVRYSMEELLSQKNEKEYATAQAGEWNEIFGYMDLICSGKDRKMLPTGEVISIPRTEAPAYFEWVLWRAFLAIDSLVNEPYEARRFKVDQDFLPISTAPGNGPDLLLEFDDFVLAVEVTLTTSSRQEAAEGEPVRRHVANLVLAHRQNSGKPVYGLFIAKKIDSNTAETFRIGVWYTQDDERMELNVVPISLEAFQEFFEALFLSGRVETHLIRELLDDCHALRADYEAPEWKREIEGTVRACAADLSSSFLQHFLALREFSPYRATQQHAS